MSFYPTAPSVMRHNPSEGGGTPAHEASRALDTGDAGSAGGATNTLLSTITQQCSRNPAQFQRHFWRHQMDLVESGFDSDGKPIDFYNLGSASNGNSSALPLARIKKVMKNDDEVKVCATCRSC